MSAKIPSYEVFQPELAAGAVTISGDEYHVLNAIVQAARLTLHAHGDREFEALAIRIGTRARLLLDEAGLIDRE